MTTDQPQQSPASSDPADAPTTAPPQGEIVARAGRYYRNTRYALLVMFLVMGGWFALDGWKRWPEENARVRDLKIQQQAAEEQKDQAELGRVNAELKNYKEHSDWDLLFQKILAIGLPIIGITLLVRALHNSRGEYRLSGTKLSAPGHPTIDLNEIEEVDNNLWDRKGIAWIKYKTADGQTGEMRLDDFLYDRPPTDAIYERVAKHMGLDEEEDEDEEDEEENEDEETSNESHG